MKYKYIIYSVLLLCTPHAIFPKVSNERLNGWLQLGDLRQKMDNTIIKYDNLQAELTNETNTLLEQGIHGGDELAQKDPYAALVIYRDLELIQKKAEKTNLDIAAINKKFQNLSDYITKTIKELESIRRKHLHLP